MKRSKDDATYKSMADDGDEAEESDDTAIFGDDNEEPTTGFDSGYLNDQER